MTNLIPEGKYHGRAKEWRLSQASTGTEQVAVSFDVTLPDGSVVERTWFGSFTDAALEWTIKALRTMGWKGLDVLELDTPQADLNANEVQLVIQHETYKEQKRDKIRYINPLGGVGALTPLAPEKRADFATRMKAAILAAEQGKPKVNGAPPPQAAKPKPAGTDDIPF